MAVLISQASLAQQKALAFVPKCSSLLSLLGSLYICYDVLRMPRYSRKMYHRLMLGMSLCDCMASFAWFFTTWPIPYDVFPAYGAAGTQATCTAQGYFAQLSISTVLYNGCLAAYYFLVIFWGWSDSRLRGSRVEYLFHGLAIAFGLGTSTAATAMGLFNPIGWDCWLSAVPMGCQESWLNNGETTCVRGDNANLWQWLFFYIPLWITIIFVGVVMGLIVRNFCRQKKAVARWDPSNQDRQSGGLKSLVFFKRISQHTRRSQQSQMSQIEKRTNETLSQAMHYVGSFLIAWTFPTILRIHELLVDEVYYHWVLLSALFVPSQGLFNFIVYMKPRYHKICAERQKQRSRSSKFRQRVRKSCPTRQDCPEGRPSLIAVEAANASTTSVWSLTNESEGFAEHDSESCNSSNNEMENTTVPVDAATMHNDEHGSSEQSEQLTFSHRSSILLKVQGESIRNFVMDLAQAMKEGDAGLGSLDLDDLVEPPAAEARSADDEASLEIPFGDMGTLEEKQEGKNEESDRLAISAGENCAEEQGQQLPRVRDTYAEDNIHTHMPHQLENGTHEEGDPKQEQIWSVTTDKKKKNISNKKKKTQDPYDDPRDEALVASLQAILMDMAANDNAEFGTA